MSLRDAWMRWDVDAGFEMGEGCLGLQNLEIPDEFERCGADAATKLFEAYSIGYRVKLNKYRADTVHSAPVAVSSPPPRYPRH